jgi:hypothetical protein
MEVYAEIYLILDIKQIRFFQNFFTIFEKKNLNPDLYVEKTNTVMAITIISRLKMQLKNVGADRDPSSGILSQN